MEMIISGHRHVDVNSSDVEVLLMNYECHRSNDKDKIIKRKDKIIKQEDKKRIIVEI